MTCLARGTADRTAKNMTGLRNILKAKLLKNDSNPYLCLVLLQLRQSLFRSITIDLSKKIAMSIRCYTGMWTDNFPISAN